MMLDSFHKSFCRLYISKTTATRTIRMGDIWINSRSWHAHKANYSQQKRQGHFVKVFTCFNAPAWKVRRGHLVIGSSVCLLLAHLSRRLEWAIVIAHRPSSVDFYPFSTSSPEPLDGCWWNLVGMKYSWSLSYKCCCFSARSAQGRIQGGAKIGNGGFPSSTNFSFSPEGYSNKPNA